MSYDESHKIAQGVVFGVDPPTMPGERLVTRTLTYLLWQTCKLLESIIVLGLHSILSSQAEIIPSVLQADTSFLQKQSL